MSIKALFKKRFTFLHIYSFWGMLAILVVAYMSWDITRIMANVDKEYAKALLGQKLTSYWYANTTLQPVVLLLALLLGIYLLITTFYLLIYRIYVQKLPVTVSQQGNKFIVEFARVKGQGVLLMTSVAGIRNDSSMTSKLKSEFQLVTPMKDGRFVFDLSFLPTGRYTIEWIDFMLHDFLGLFNVLYVKTPLSYPILIESQHNSQITSLDAESFDQDGLESQFMSDANESYFASREYRSGDPLKRIHWRHTAKTNKFMVRIPEERTLKKHELNIVLNMYVPFGKQLDQSVVIGKYLEASLVAIDTLLKLPFSKVNLYINGGGKQELHEVNTYNTDKIHGLVLEAAVGQTNTKIQQFIADKKLRDTVVLTLSSDLPSGEEKSVYAFKQSLFMRRTAKEWWGETITYKLSPLQFEGFLRSLEKINILGNTRRFFATRKLMKTTIQNEQQVAKKWRFL